VLLDQQGDKLGTIRHELEVRNLLPAYVKTASAEELLGDDTVAFADQAAHEFPIHTKAATALSALYFRRNIDAMPANRVERVAMKLAAAIRFWEIEHDVAPSLDAWHAEHTPVDQPIVPGDCLYISDAGVPRCPMRNDGEVKAAAEWLNQHRNKIEIADATEMATKIMTKAAELSVDLDPQARDGLERMAGHGIASPACLQRAIASRIPFCNVATQVKLAEIADATPKELRDPEELLKIASTLEAIDRSTGLINRWGKEIAHPVDALFPVTVKAANDFADSTVRLITGSIYDLDATSTLPAGCIADALGDDIAMDLAMPGRKLDRAKLAEMLPTLPRPDAVRFERAAAAAGVTPRVKTAAAIGTTLQEADLLALAAC